MEDVEGRSRVRGVARRRDAGGEEGRKSRRAEDTPRQRKRAGAEGEQSVG